MTFRLAIFFSTNMQKIAGLLVRILLDSWSVFEIINNINMLKNNSKGSSMNAKNIDSEEDTIPTVEDIKQEIRISCEALIKVCTKTRTDESFHSFEKNLIEQISHLGCLFFKLYLMSAHQFLDYTQWLDSGLYYLKKNPIAKTIKTTFGEVRYWRCYLVRKGKKGGGFYPLDTSLGLTRDGFSPLVIKLVTKLATRVSFKTSVLLFHSFYGWAPSTESIEHLVLGVGRVASAYMEVVDAPSRDGEVLIVEVDGKATATATEKELAKRRGKRKKKERTCKCQHHRGKNKRKKNKKKRRKKGDKSKNGRSTTIVVMYTLKRGSDGLLHGPINKIVWASYAPRKVMLAWARRQATKRGFPPGTDKRIHIAVDGEKCLKTGLSELFPEATFALDIRHLEEKIWKIGRTYFPEGSKELEEWVDEKRKHLYEGSVLDLLDELKEMRDQLSKRAKRDKKKRDTFNEVIPYMERRLDMMDYKKYIEEDLPIASGVVEGAARYVVGERMDCSGMRWIPGRAEALLHLRCIELNGDYDQFFEWVYNRWKGRLGQGESVQVRTDEPIDLISNTITDILHVVPEAA